jgi:hypothetical protein
MQGLRDRDEIERRRAEAGPLRRLCGVADILCLLSKGNLLGAGVRRLDPVEQSRQLRSRLPVSGSAIPGQLPCLAMPGDPIEQSGRV